MGFFNLLETVFFISLAITFVLIMMLVYHFKGRLIVLEQKCDTMFEIMNNMIKEMKNMQIKFSSQNTMLPSNSIPFSREMPASGGFQIDLLSMLGNKFQHTPMEYLDENNEEDDNENEEDAQDDDEDSNDEEDESEFKKIVVSDTEIESDNEDDENENEKVKVIHIDIGNPETKPAEIPNLEEVDVELVEEDHEKDGDGDADEEALEDNKDSLDKPIDYKKMDISYLRTLVITRGLAVDTKRLKKADLIKLLSEE
jgi:hypothetical protein